MSNSGTTQYESFMQLDSDGDFMEIKKKIPKTKMFVISANDNEIEKQRKMNKKNRAQAQ